MSLDEIVAFQELFWKMHSDSYTWALWGAAYLINGGCSDDGFDYFRGWLICQGRGVFESALRDPDSLASHSAPEVEFEDALSLGLNAYRIASGGKEMPGVPHPFPELGEGWDFEDPSEMKRRYPRLSAKYDWGDSLV
jgi:hypothetical protein